MKQVTQRLRNGRIEDRNRRAGWGASCRACKPGQRRNRQRGLLNANEVERIVKANTNGTEDNALRIWALLTPELWQQAFFS